MLRHLAAVCLTLAYFTRADKPSPDFQQYITEPNITAVTIDIIHNNRPEDQAPGYFFLAPYKGPQGWGPQIFDDRGRLIWWGGDNVRIRAIDLHPCLFNTTEYNHLCYNDAIPFEQGGHSVGLVRFFHNNYTQIGEDFGAMGDLRGPDIHELNTPTAEKGKTFIQDIYQIRQMDLSPWKGKPKGYILDGCFQEIDLITREIVFQWCSLDHVDIDLTYIYLNGRDNYTIPGLAGTGDDHNSPWDWFHINSVDKSTSGDYIISSRHANSILHVAGNNNQDGHSPGDIIWYLGGKRNSFEIQDNLNFSAQHTIRYIKDDDETDTRISLFNNAWEGHTNTSDASNGMLVTLDIKNKRASVMARFVQPDGLLAHDQGSLQMLPNGNGLIGWGRCNYFTEYSPSGEVLYHAQFGGKGDCDDQKGEKRANIFFISSFRAWKFPWKGYPSTRPKVVAFTPHCGNRTNLFMSWNGATEVASWSIYGTNSSNIEQDPNAFKHLLTIPKVGFETRKTVDFSLYIYVEALDKDGTRLSASHAYKNFVPNEEMDCTSARCLNTAGVSNTDSVVESCLASHLLSNQSGLMSWNFEHINVDNDILLKICVPFAAIFMLLFFTRNRWLSACARFSRDKPGVELKDP